MFKSFSPKKFATKSRNNYKNTITYNGISLGELCKECGYPYAHHYGVNCPTGDRFLLSSVDIRKTVVPYHASKKISLKVQQIRAFKKLLLKYDLLEEFPKKLKSRGFLTGKRGRVKSMTDLYSLEPSNWGDSYVWHTEDIKKGIGKVYNEWYEYCRDRGWN